MAHYKTRYEYTQEKMVDWLEQFANDQGTKKGAPEPAKEAGFMDKMKSILDRGKASTVESKVENYRKMVGLDMIGDLEKAGEQENTNKEAEKTVTASRPPLSIRDKTAQQQEPKQLLNNIKEFVTQVIHNRNGAIATPAILEQLEHYLKLDKEWLRNNYEDIEKIIEQVRQEFHPKVYDDASIQELTRTDDPMKEKESPPIAQQTSPAS